MPRSEHCELQTFSRKCPTSRNTGKTCIQWQRKIRKSPSLPAHNRVRSGDGKPSWPIAIWNTVHVNPQAVIELPLVILPYRRLQVFDFEIVRMFRLLRGAECEGVLRSQWMDPARAVATLWCFWQKKAFSSSTFQSVLVDGVRKIFCVVLVGWLDVESFGTHLRGQCGNARQRDASSYKKNKWEARVLFIWGQLKFMSSPTLNFSQHKTKMSGF